MMKKLLALTLLVWFSSISFAQEANDLSAFFSQDDEFLEVDEAFALSVDTFDDELIANWTIAPGYYLYQHRLKVAVKQASLGTIVLPEGKHKTDEYFGEVQIYTKHLGLGIPYTSNKPSFVIELEFQGCAEKGLCYPPTSRYFAIDRLSKTARAIAAEEFSAINEQAVHWTAPPLADANTNQVANQPSANKTTNSNGNLTKDSASTPQNKESSKSGFISEKDQIINTLNDSSILFGFFSLVVLGIGLAFTPCVFPMMPIISSIIAGQGKNITPSKAFFLSLTYTQAMAIPYVIIGFVVAYIGASATATMQSPPFVIGAAVIFLILSLGMFGFFEIQLPPSLQNKLNSVSQKQEGGTYIGAAIMGVVSGAVVSPCVTIPLIAVLTWISQVGDALVGALYLYGLALGMGIPLIILGVGGGKLLPRAGSWMNAVKAFFGVMLIAVALYITKHLIPGPVNLLLWGMLLVVCSVYMGALNSLAETASGWLKLWKGVGLVLLIYGGALIIGAAQGHTSLLQPLANATSHASNITASAKSDDNSYVDHAGFIRIKSNADLDRYLAQAKAEGKTVMLDFFAEYCTACFEFAELTFPDPKVQAALSNTLLLQADVTAGDDEDKALMNRFKIFGLPSILFFDKEGNEITSLRAEGFEDPATFAMRIDAALGE
jgi:thiol:disulfide interchange protein DsbD